MIEAKKVEIKKLNKFDLGYALCTPNEINKKGKVKDLDIDHEITHRITHADHVLLLISHDLLTSRMKEELYWTSRYVEVDIVASSKKLLSVFKDMRIHHQEVDKSIDFDYLSIIDEIGTKYCYCLDGPYRVNNDIVGAYFGKASATNFDTLNDASSIFIVGKGNKLNDQIYNYCKGKNIPVNYIADAKRFDLNVYNETLKENMDLYIASNINDGIYCIRKDYLFKIVTVNGSLIKFPIPDVKDNIDTAIFKNLRLKGINKEFPDDSYTTCNGNIVKLDIQDVNVVEYNVNCTTMKDYVEQNFDSSSTNNYDTYAGVARVTRYIYTLNPPRFNKSTFNTSSIYSNFCNYVKDWIKTYSQVDMKLMYNEALAFDENHVIDAAINNAIDANEYVIKKLQKLDLIDYKERCNNFTILFDKVSDKLDSIFRDMCRGLMLESFNDKLKVFNDQIDKNNKAITDMEKSMKENVSLSANAFRIESKKRENETFIKQRDAFAAQNNTVIEKEVDDFLTMAKKFKTDTKRGTTSLLGNVEEANKTKLDLFGEFLSKYHDILGILFAALSGELKMIASCDLPAGYKVYDNNSKKCIVIKDIDEYKLTENMCKRYNLECVAEEVIDK